MKNLLYLLLFCLFIQGTLASQSKQAPMGQDDYRTFLMQVDGDVLYIRQRAQKRLLNAVELDDGSVLNPDGLYQTTDRKKFQLYDGECIDNEGIKYRDEHQYIYKLKKENKLLSQAQIRERNQNRHHFVLVGGEVFQIQNLSQNKVIKQLVLENGMVVGPNGSYEVTGTQPKYLKNGECLSSDGGFYKNPYQLRRALIKNDRKNK